MNDNPILSVVIPTYNNEKYIETAIESVFIQNMSTEIIVVDDCSTDQTYQVIKKYLKRPNFHYIKNAQNSGVAFSRNRGVSYASGEYIAFLDADDWWTPGKLKVQLDLIEKRNAVLCTTGRELMNSNGTFSHRIIPVPETITFKDLLKHNCINCSSVVVKTSVAKEFPMEKDYLHEDYLTWLRILQKYNYAVGVNEPYLKYRLSEGGKSRNKIKSAKMTYLVYKELGLSPLKSMMSFFSYTIHGFLKYL